jgi:hypothetical protein
MKPVVLLLAAIALASVLAGYFAFGPRSAPPRELETLVRDFAFRLKPSLKSDTRFAIEEYSIDGLKALKVRIILARYLSPDGSQFNEALLIYHDGKLTPFACTFGGSGLMSALVLDGKLYYTYSWGSGIHRSHVGRLTIFGGKLMFAESGPLFDQDCFIKRDGARLLLEEGEFLGFNAWKTGQRIGEISANESGFAVINGAGKEIESLVGKPVEDKAEQR